jgi:ABC-type lipoprotein release transport system permease subunit
MGLPLGAALRLAWRNLWRNHRRTLIMLAAITVGVWAMIFLTSLMRGMMDEMVMGAIRALPGHAQIHHRSYRNDPSIVNSMPAPSGALLEVLGHEGITTWSSRVRVPAVISSERDSRGVVLVGLEPGAERGMGLDPASIVQGRYLESIDDGGLVVGEKMLQRLETRLGKRVVVMSQDPDNQVADRGFRIVGVYRAELDSLEETFIYGGRRTVQKMLGLGDRVSEVAILGEGYRELEAWYPAVAAEVDADLEYLHWRELDPVSSSMLRVQDSFNLVFMVIIFVALSFGLVNTLMMAVFERVREIGLMMALGMRPGSIIVQVLLESFMLLSLGLVLGNVLAAVSILPLESGIRLDAFAEGMELFGLSAVLYPRLYVDDMLMSTLIVIVLGLLASLLPAWRAASFDPVRALSKN